MGDAVDDQWLGSLHQFPTILHARASLSFDLSPDSLQKALVAGLLSLRALFLPRMITAADKDGYSEGKMGFKIGVGNGEGLDVVHAPEEERILDRVVNVCAFGAVDLSF